MSKMIVPAAVLAALLAAGGAVHAKTEGECQSAWTSADTNKDGVLTENEAPAHYAMLRISEKPVAGGKLSKDEFMKHCLAGTFGIATTSTEPGAPLAGANSFTENQARDRVLARGFTNVSALTKDDKGIWRGTASQGGKTIKVAIDYKGNVVAQ